MILLQKRLAILIDNDWISDSKSAYLIAVLSHSLPFCSMFLNEAFWELTVSQPSPSLSHNFLRKHDIVSRMHHSPNKREQLLNWRIFPYDDSSTSKSRKKEFCSLFEILRILFCNKLAIKSNIHESYSKIPSRRFCIVNNRHLCLWFWNYSRSTQQSAVKRGKQFFAEIHVLASRLLIVF